MGMILMTLGSLVSFVGGIWLLVLAFKKSIGWGLASLLIPFVILVFAFMNLEVTKKPLLIVVAGIVLSVIGGVMGGAALMQQMPAG